MRDLSELRAEIDAIDTEMVKLFERRMEISGEVAEYKVAVGKKILDKEREKDKIRAVKAMTHSDFNAHGAEELYQQIMAMSRKLQYQRMEEKAVGRLPFVMVEELEKEHVRVVYQGVEGAYSQQAMFEFFGEEADHFHVERWRDAMEAIAEGMADYAVLPIENSTAGIVNDNYDLLQEFDNYIVGEQILSIRHALLGTPDAEISEIRTVYSHPQALMQCSQFLHDQKQIRQVSLENTAVAAKKIVEDKDRTQAAIASEIAAELYGLKVLRAAIQNSESNTTRFIILSSRPIYCRDASKVSIAFELPHRSGTLYNILGHFIFNGVNMRMIESRPIPGRTWEYRFFVDIEGNLADAAIRNALNGVAAEAQNMRILGNY